MNGNDKNEAQKNVEQILNTSTFDSAVKLSIGELRLSVKRKWILVVFGLVVFLLLYYIIFTTGIISKTIIFVELINTIVIALLGSVITGYAIFQALATGSTLRRLIIAKHEEKSLLIKYNGFFLVLAVMYLFIIFTNYLILLFLKTVPTDWFFPFLPLKTNRVVCVVLVTLYLTIVANSIIEFKSFIYNLYQCFNINSATNVLDSIKEQNKDT
ncbi:hypothetical protein ACE3NQ_13480 [Paenibacillus terreus]|uniref:Uncharacterized protein n=1 Tax=Paenibacillus terreus TaxID=1387834 RepID=A0ABV5B8B0_9BACL